MAPKKRPWFRFYVEAIADRKLRRLKPEHRWLWVVVLASARTSPMPGVLVLTDGTPIDAADLADLAAMPVTTVRRGLAALAAGAMIHEDDDRWVVTNWAKRQFESDASAARTAEYRASKDPPCDDDVTAYQRHDRPHNAEDVTPPENRKQKTENRTLTSQDQSTGAAPKRATPAPDKFEVTSGMRSWARSKEITINLDAETEKFLDRNRAKGAMYRDWLAAWRTWMRNAQEYAIRDGRVGAPGSDRYWTDFHGNRVLK